MAFQRTRSSRRLKNNHSEDKKKQPFFSKASETATGNAFFQPKLSIGQPGDKYEREADEVADAVVNQSNQQATIQQNGISSIQRVTLSSPMEEEKLNTAESRMEEDKMIQEKPELQKMGEEEEESLQTKSNASNPNVASTQMSQQIKNKAGKGRAMGSKVRSEMESSIGADFSQVNIHTDTEAVAMNKSLKAQAFTHGKDIYFNAGKYNPESSDGKRLLAHELTHVVQQNKSYDNAVDKMPAIQKNDDGTGSSLSDYLPDMPEMPDLEDFIPPGLGQPLCPIPSYCPSFYCSPYPSQAEARIARDLMADGLLFGISQRINSRVVPFWRTYLDGGSSPMNVTSLFEADFTNSLTTRAAVVFLYNAIVHEVMASPPSFPAGQNTVILDLATLIPAEIAALGDPSSSDQMNFNIIGEVPGNLVGGIGANQTAHPIGARPSPFDDFRGASGTVTVKRLSNGALRIAPTIRFTVHDTIDFCPGDCGGPMERFATVPMSMFEASGISGDVPLQIEYPAPPITPFETAPGFVNVPPVFGQISAASGLRIRTGPNTTSSIVGIYSNGRRVRIMCKVNGEEINGNNTWYRTSLGYISGAYVSNLEGTPTNC